MSTEPRLSIVIPTHQRAAILKQCLEHLAQQTIADQLQVIVVSDGEDEETAKMMNTTNYQLPTTNYFSSIPKSQQGVARNCGIQKALAPYTLYLGDDFFLAPDACEKHLVAHEESQKKYGTNRLAVLGFTTWDPAVGITPTMLWLEKTGWQFGYPMIEQYRHDLIPSGLQHRFTYTSHISLPTKIAKEHPFREDITLYGWEDILWGIKLRDAGIKLFYEPNATALHHHHLSLKDSLKRMETLGESARIMSELDPSLDRLPKGLKKMAYRMIAQLPTMRGRHAKAFLRGMEG